MNEHSYVTALHRQMKRMNAALPVPVDIWKIFDPYHGGKADARYEYGQKDLRTAPRCNIAEIWVEYKFLALPKRDATSINLCERKDGLSHLQQRWLRQRYLNNRSIAVIVGSDEGSLILTDLSWEAPLFRTDFKNGLSIKQVAEWLMHPATGTQEGENGKKFCTSASRRTTSADSPRTTRAIRPQKERLGVDASVVS